MSSPKNSLQTEHFLEALVYLLRETFEGSPEGQPSAYLDRGVGLFNTLHSITAEQVSREFDGTTIAAQTEHAKFYLDRLCEFINGRTERVNWAFECEDRVRKRAKMSRRCRFVGHAKGRHGDGPDRAFGVSSRRDPATG
jgi:hypothetical protein